MFSNDFIAAIPRIRDLAGVRSIKRDFGGKTNMEDGQRRQLALLARV